MSVIQVKPAQNTHSDKTYSTNEDQMKVSTDIKINPGPSQELYNTLRPMLLTMKVFGMYPLQETSAGKGLGSRVLWLYSGMMLALIWGFTFVCISSLQFPDSYDRLMYKLILVCFHMYASCQGIVVFLMCVRQKGWRELFKVYQYVQEGVWPTNGYSHVHKRIYVYVGMSWSFILSSVGFVIYNSFWEDIFIDFYPFYDSKTYNLALRCFVAIGYIIMNIYWVIPVVLSLILNDLVATDFRLFNKRLHLEQREQPLGLYTKIGEIRKIHGKLTNVTASVDTMVSGLVGLCVIFNLLISCCSVYTLINNSHSLMFTISYIFWATCNLLIIFALTGSCALVNAEVGNRGSHSPVITQYLNKR